MSNKRKSKIPTAKVIARPLVGHLDSVELENFRGFPHLKFNELRRVNLVAGKNDSGKTSVLEALFFNAGLYNPGLSVTVNALRGVQKFKMSSVTEIFKHLFHNGNFQSPIKVIGLRNGKRESTVINLRDGSTIPLSDEGETLVQADSTEETAFGRLVFQYNNDLGFSTKAWTTIAPDESGNMAFRTSYEHPLPKGKHQRGIYMTSRPSNDIDRFSKVTEAGQKENLYPILRILEPRLQSLELLQFGGETLIHADFGDKRFLPLNFCGEGLSKLVGYLLAIYDASGGIVLIDEFENGIHYSVMREVWEGVYKLSEQWNTQIVASTHSWECIVAAHNAMSQKENSNFLLHRLSRNGNHTTVKTYDEATLATAIEQGIEVR